MKKNFAVLAMILAFLIIACGGTPTSVPVVADSYEASDPLPTVGPDVLFRAEWHSGNDLDPSETSIVPGWTYKFYQEHDLKFQVAELVAADGAVLGSVSPLALEGKVLGNYSLSDIEGVYLRMPDGTEIHPILPFEGRYINYK